MNKKKIDNLMEVMHSVGFEIDEVKEDNNFIFLHFFNNNYDLTTICYCKFSKRYILTEPNKEYITKQYKRLVDYIQKNI